MRPIKQGTRENWEQVGTENTKDQHFFLEQWGSICNFYKGKGEHDPPYMTLTDGFPPQYRLLPLKLYCTPFIVLHRHRVCIAFQGMLLTLVLRGPLHSSLLCSPALGNFSAIFIIKLFLVSVCMESKDFVCCGQLMSYAVFCDFLKMSIKTALWFSFPSC